MGNHRMFEISGAESYIRSSTLSSQYPLNLNCEITTSPRKIFGICNSSQNHSKRKPAEFPWDDIVFYYPSNTHENRFAFTR